MKQRVDYGKRITILLFCLYLAAITWIILFKMTLPGDPLPHLRAVNLVPFGGSMIVNNRISYDEIIQNILVFVPLGIYLAMLFPKCSLVQKLLPASALSLGYEVLQFVFSIGASDITDWIGNTLGALLGLGVYAVFLKLFHTRTDFILNLLAALATISMSFLLLLLVISN